MARIGPANPETTGRRWAGHSPLRTTLALAVLVVIVYVGICALMFFRQESLVYFPDKHVRATPADVGLAFDSVTLRTADGESLGAWWVPAPRARGALILCHGNAGTLAERLPLMLLCGRLGLSVMAFDYRGYGASTGTPTEQGTYRDMDAAVAETARRGVSQARTIFFGESLGGAVAVEAASRLPCAGLVLESTFTSVPDVARHYYPWLPAGLLLRIRYDSAARITGLRCPKLFMHGPQDDIIPYVMGRRLFEAAPEPKLFGDLQGGHNDGGVAASEAAQAVLARWLDGVLGPRQSGPEGAGKGAKP